MLAKDMPLNTWPRDKLLELPVRNWDAVSEPYDSIMVVATGEEHDSGWGMMAVIGVRDNQPVEIASRCADDLEWKVPEPNYLYGVNHTFSLGQMRCDCGLASGAIHFWSRENKFWVGAALSSTEIRVIPKEEMAKRLLTGGSPPWER